MTHSLKNASTFENENHCACKLISFFDGLLRMHLIASAVFRRSLEPDSPFLNSIRIEFPAL